MFVITWNGKPVSGHITKLEAYHHLTYLAGDKSGRNYAIDEFSGGKLWPDSIIVHSPTRSELKEVCS